MYELLSRICYYLGLTELFLRFRNKKEIVILMGHRLGIDEVGFFGGVSERDFDALLGKLSKHFDFITSDDVFNVLNGTQKLKRKSILLTFDDGFKDNYTKAFPILKKHNIPATIYLVYESIDKDQLPWSQRLGHYIQETSQREVEITLPIKGKYSLQTRKDRLDLYQLVKKELIVMPREDRESALSSISKALNIAPPVDGMLNWDNVTEMMNSNITFGAHTLTHPSCALIKQEEAEHEILQSKTLLETKINCPVHHFAFPRGSFNDQLLDFTGKHFKTFYLKRHGGVFSNNLDTKPNELIRTGVSNGPFYETLFNVSGVNSTFLKLKSLFR